MEGVGGTGGDAVQRWRASARVGRASTSLDHVGSWVGLQSWNSVPRPPEAAGDHLEAPSSPSPELCKAQWSQGATCGQLGQGPARAPPHSVLSTRTSKARGRVALPMPSAGGPAGLAESSVVEGNALDWTLELPFGGMSNPFLGVSPVPSPQSGLPWGCAAQRGHQAAPAEAHLPHLAEGELLVRRGLPCQAELPSSKTPPQSHQMWRAEAPRGQARGLCSGCGQ